METLPADFLAALKKAGLYDFFNDCTGAHQHEYLKWIGDAKRPATRIDRIGKAVRMIAEKQQEEIKRSKKPR